METPVSTLADASPVEEETLYRRRRLLADPAEEIYPGAGWKIHQLWREHNEKLFGRQMQHCGVQFGLAGRAYRSPKGRDGLAEDCYYGRWWPERQVITLHRCFLHRDGSRCWLRHERLGGRFVKDVLLHHMVHQYIDTVRGVGGDGRSVSSTAPLHNNPFWVGDVNRLSEELDLGEGMAAVHTEDATGEQVPKEILTPRETALWPYLSRPEGYYEADPEAVFAEKLPHVG